MDTLCTYPYISISQVDKTSPVRTERIRLVPQIFRMIERVLVSLGPEANNSDLAIEAEYLGSYQIPFVHGEKALI